MFMDWGGPWFNPIASLGTEEAAGIAGMELKAAMASSSPAPLRHRGTLGFGAAVVSAAVAAKV